MDKLIKIVKKERGKKERREMGERERRKERKKPCLKNKAETQLRKVSEANLLPPHMLHPPVSPAHTCIPREQMFHTRRHLGRRGLKTAMTHGILLPPPENTHACRAVRNRDHQSKRPGKAAAMGAAPVVCKQGGLGASRASLAAAVALCYAVNLSAHPFHTEKRRKGLL